MNVYRNNNEDNNMNSINNVNNDYEGSFKRKIISVLFILWFLVRLF